MHLDRRQTLQLIKFGALAAGGSSLLSACASMTSKGASLRAGALLPLSGRLVGLGQSLSLAIQLAQPAGTADKSFFFVDTQGSPEGAAIAAKRAMSAGAQMVVGPVFGAEVIPVVQAAGAGVPVITFSNDPSLIGRGAFIFGITPSQTTSAIVRYASQQGIRRIALVGLRTPWATGVEASARAIAGSSGAELTAAVYRSETSGTNLMADVKSACGGKLPDAVLLPDGADAVNNFAPQLSKASVQLLGTIQWSGLDLSSIAAMRGAWYAAPDPSGFEGFSSAYQRAYGATPGLLAGLAFDAALLAGTVAQTGIVSRDAIVSSPGVQGVTGSFKFNADGSCVRRLAILSVESGGLRVVSPVSAA